LHGGQKLWDYAAGSLILEESGGHYCSLDEQPFWEGQPWARSVMASLNPELFNQWRDWLRTAR